MYRTMKPGGACKFGVTPKVDLKVLYRPLEWFSEHKLDVQFRSRRSLFRLPHDGRIFYSSECVSL